MAGYMKDLGNGKYQFEVSKGHKGDGSRNKAYRTIQAKGKTPEAQLKYAEKQLALFIAEVENGQHQKPTHLSFSEYVEKWRESTSVKELAPKTRFRYFELLNLHILPQIGGYKLEDINALDIENAYNELRKPRKRKITKKDGAERTKEYILSETTLKRIHALISVILQSAYKKGLIKENPISRVDAPKVAEHEQNIYDDEQIQTFIEALEDAELQFKTIAHIALSTGAREGEIAGLELQAIDFEKKTMEIRQAAQYLPGKGVFLKPPKNKNSIRIIGLDDYVLNLISQLEHEHKILKVKLGTKWQGGNLGDITDDADKENSKPNMLFIQADGSPMYPYTPVKQLKKFLEEKGLPPLRFHDLRHTAASYAIFMGENVANVSRMLGHAKPTTTLGIYTHAFKKQHEVTAQKMSTMYAKKKEKDKGKDNKAN